MVRLRFLFSGKMKNAKRKAIYGEEDYKSGSHNKTSFNEVMNRHFLDQYL